MASNPDRSLGFHFSFPQWIKSSSSAVHRYNFDDMAFSPPLDDDSFLHLKQRRPSRGDPRPPDSDFSAPSSIPKPLVAQCIPQIQKGFLLVKRILPFAVPTVMAACESVSEEHQATILEKYTEKIAASETSSEQTPYSTPQPSPQNPRRHPNPYFTATSNKTVGSAAWFVTSSGDETENTDSKQKTPESQRVRRSQKSSLLREMNMLSPLSM